MSPTLGYPRHNTIIDYSLASISQLCGKLAAEGKVVIAMEHRDGTAPATIYPVDGKVEAHHYIKVEELECVLLVHFRSLNTEVYLAGRIR